MKKSAQGEEYNDTGAQSASTNLAQIPVSDGKENHEMIIGVDPNTYENPSPGQEMQERSGIRMLSARAGNGSENPKPIDIMDLDQIMEDENVAMESGAVRHVGFID